MKRPFANKRLIGPVFTFGSTSYSSNNAGKDLLEPTPKLVDPRSFSRDELEKSARMYALFHEQMAKSMFKYNWGIPADTNSDLPDPHYTEREIYNDRPLSSLVSDEFDVLAPTLRLSVSNVHLFGSATQGDLDIREPSAVHRKAKKISDDVRKLQYPSGYQIPFGSSDIQVKGWESKPVEEKKRLGENFLEKIFPVIEDTVRIDSLERYTKLWTYNLMYSDIDFIMSYEDVERPGKSDFIDYIVSYNDDGETITKMSVISGKLVGTLPHPQDSLLVGDGTSIPDDLPLSLRSEVNNAADIGSPTQSEREQFVSMWKEFADVWRGDSRWMEVRGTEASFRTPSDLVLSEKEITGEIPVVAEEEPRYL